MAQEKGWGQAADAWPDDERIKCKNKLLEVERHLNKTIAVKRVFAGPIEAPASLGSRWSNLPKTPCLHPVLP
jgi:hypothetical protein